MAYAACQDVALHMPSPCPSPIQRNAPGLRRWAAAALGCGACAAAAALAVCAAPRPGHRPAAFAIPAPVAWPRAVAVAGSRLGPPAPPQPVAPTVLPGPLRPAVRAAASLQAAAEPPALSPAPGLASGVTSGLLALAAVGAAAMAAVVRSVPPQPLAEQCVGQHCDDGCEAQPCRCCARAGQPLHSSAAAPDTARSWAMAAATARGQPRIDPALPPEWSASPDDLLDTLLKKAHNEAALLQCLEQNWEQFARTGRYVTELQHKTAQGNKAAELVLEGMNTVVAKLMEVARARLATLMQTPEINDLDRRINQMAQQHEIDMAFLRVVDLNIEAAQRDGAVNNLNFFTHIRTRCVEEIEKHAKPADGLISRALRQTDPGIRERILEDFLLPKTIITLPSGKELPLDQPAPAKVTIAQFADAVADTVARLQGLGVDPALVDDAVEDVRQLAKDVRQVLIKAYDGEKVRWYERRLGEVFGPVLAPRQGGPAPAEPAP
eukprot:EG_transcript_7883